MTEHTIRGRASCQQTRSNSPGAPDQRTSHGEREGASAKVAKRLDRKTQPLKTVLGNTREDERVKTYPRARNKRTDLKVPLSRGIAQKDHGEGRYPVAETRLCGAAEE